jgi:pimeloyl-ACP methyl ester carboxylesterase
MVPSFFTQFDLAHPDVHLTKMVPSPVSLTSILEDGAEEVAKLILVCLSRDLLTLADLAPEDKCMFSELEKNAPETVQHDAANADPCERKCKLSSSCMLNLTPVKAVSSLTIVEVHKSITADGFHLILFRLPPVIRDGSAKCVYFQHGLMDSPNAWTAKKGDSLAMQAWREGADVFFGYLRGVDDHNFCHDLASINMALPEAWDYSVDDHVLDVAAHVNTIREVRRFEETELYANPPSFLVSSRQQGQPTLRRKRPTRQAGDLQIRAVGHSMGCCILLAYVVRCQISCERKLSGGWGGLDHHHFSNVVLMAPAGVHRTILPQWELILSSFGKLADLLRLPDNFPVPYSPRDMHEPVAHFLDYAKQANRIVKQVVSIAGNYLMGGGSEHFPLVNGVDLSVYPLGRTSVKVMRHGLQCKNAGVFNSYDYGDDAENVKRYGQKKPPCYLDFYDKIDVPVDFVGGGDDRLIPAEDVRLHCEYLQRVSPHLASYKEFPCAGHLSFTIGQDETEWQAIVEHVLDKAVRNDFVPNERVDSVAGPRKTCSCAWGFTKIGEDFRSLRVQEAESYFSLMLRFSRDLAFSSGAWVLSVLTAPLVRLVPMPQQRQVTASC